MLCFFYSTARHVHRHDPQPGQDIVRGPRRNHRLARKVVGGVLRRPQPINPVQRSGTPGHRSASAAGERRADGRQARAASLLPVQRRGRAQRRLLRTRGWRVSLQLAFLTRSHRYVALQQVDFCNYLGGRGYSIKYPGLPGKMQKKV
jgi:hypothetical protein